MSYILVLIVTGGLFSGGDVRQIGPFENKKLCLSARDKLIDFAVNRINERGYQDVSKAKGEARLAGMRQFLCVKVKEEKK